MAGAVDVQGGDLVAKVDLGVVGQALDAQVLQVRVAEKGVVGVCLLRRLWNA